MHLQAVDDGFVQYGGLQGGRARYARTTRSQDGAAVIDAALVGEDVCA
jgi:hypothetical protein